MLLYQHDDALLCEVFLESLKEGAIAWFQQRPHGSITAFVNLSARFAQAYMLQICEPKQAKVSLM